MMRNPLFLLLLVHHVSGLAFCPADRKGDQMWDTWLYKKPEGGWLLNYLVKHHSSAWNGVSAAVSSDGAHFVDKGVGISKDCANATSDCAVWLGSGSVWKHLGTNTDDDEFVMNFSQEYDCESGDADGCQSIFFATSKDLLKWTPVAPDAQKNGGLVFKYNASEYALGGRWDCIAVLPRPQGGYYGYWTATPTVTTPGAPGYCGGASKHCGAGFGESQDGLHWTALPTPGPEIGAEVGGLCQLSGRTFMTFDAGHLFEAPAATGPFKPSAKNFNFLTEEGHSAFARLWGELYTQESGLALVTHQQLAGGAIYAGLVKRAVVGSDGVLRAHWWGANDALKGDALAIAPSPSPGYQITACNGTQCLSSGLWLEGSLSAGADGVGSGLWLQTNGGGFATTVTCSSTACTFVMGEKKSPSANWTSRPVSVDRGIAPTKSGASLWRAVVRNAWSGQGMTEFYVDDVLALPFTVSGALTGSFAIIGKGSVTAVHRLTLPEQ